MRRNDLLVGIGLSFICYAIAPDVFEKAEAICFQIGMVVLGSFASMYIREAFEEIRERREAMNIRRQNELREKRAGKQVNFPWRKRYYILPIEERY